MTRQPFALKLLRLVLSCFFILLTFMSQSQTTDTSTVSWKEVQFNKLSFKYPPDWVFRKKGAPGDVTLSLNPWNVTRLKGWDAFEIIPVGAEGHHFSDFKKDVTRAISEKAHDETKLIYKKDTVFKKLNAVTAKLMLYYKSNPTPVVLYAVDGGDTFYIISFLIFKDKGAMNSKLDAITNSILRTLVIRK